MFFWEPVAVGAARMTYPQHSYTINTAAAPPAAAEFSSPLVLASTDELAPHSLVGGCLCCEAYHAWYCCLLSARAELAVCGTTTVAYRMLPQLVGSAFVAAARALGKSARVGFLGGRHLEVSMWVVFLGWVETVSDGGQVIAAFMALIWWRGERGLICKVQQTSSGGQRTNERHCWDVCGSPEGASAAKQSWCHISTVVQRAELKHPSSSAVAVNLRVLTSH